ncbi:hypothetical protein KEM55_006666, partial [Ascosphaera atra]
GQFSPSPPVELSYPPPPPLSYPSQQILERSRLLSNFTPSYFLANMSSPHEIQTHAVSSGIHTENCHTEKDASYAVDGKRGSVSNPSDVDIEAESVPPLDEDNKAPQEVGTYEEGSDTSSKVPFYRTEQFRRYAKIGIWSALFALATG